MLAGQRHLLTADHGKGQFARADQLHAVGLEAIIEFDVETFLGKVAFIQGDVERRILHVGDIAHRQADARQGGCGRGSRVAASGQNKDDDGEQ